MSDIEKNNEDKNKLEQFADAIINNPLKAMFWGLLILVTTLFTTVTYQFKSSSAEKAKQLEECTTDNKKLNDTITVIRERYNQDIKNIYITNNQELLNRIKIQERLNRRVNSTIKHNEEFLDSIENIK